MGEVRTWPRVLATLAALLGPAVGIGNLVLLGGMAAAGRLVVESAMVIPILLGVVLSIVNTVLVVRSARTPVPPAIPIALALVPMALGSVVAIVQAMGARGDLTADPAMRATAMAAAISGALGAHAVGAAMSAALLGAVASSSAWVSFAPVGERRIGAGLGFGLALGLGVHVVLTALSFGIDRTLGSVGPWWETFGGSMSAARYSGPWAAFVGAVSQVMVVGMIASAARTEGAAAPTVKKAFVVVAVAIGAEACLGGVFVTAAQGIAVFSAIANADPESKVMMLEHASAELFATSVFVGLGATTIAASLGLGLRRNAQGELRGLLLPAVLLASTLALHLASVLACRGIIASASGGDPLIEAAAGVIY